MSSSKVAPAGDKSVGDLVGVTAITKGLTEFQVKLRASKKFQQIVAATTIFAVFCDILGTAVIMPGLASVCAFAEGGPADQMLKAMPDAASRAALLQTIEDGNDPFVSPHAFNDPKPPVKFSLSMNLVMSAGFVASGAGSIFWGRMVDRIGCKVPLQINLFCGIFGYVIIYASAIWVKSYWLFLLGNVWNNFFGCSMDIGFAYFGKLFTGAERENYQGAVMGMGLMGGTVGAFVVMPFSNNPPNGKNYFDAMWMALGFTVLAFTLLTVVLVQPPPSTEEKKKSLGTSPLAKRILIIAVVASALDSGGDEGTRMARGTILTAVFPKWQTPEKQNYLLLGLLIMVIISLILLTTFRKMFNLAVIAVLGCLATLAVQLILLIELDDIPFLAIWYSGKLFGFLSTLASSFIIQEVAPNEELGYWNGLNQAITNASMAVAPLIFATVYDSVGNARGQEMLACTAAVSFLAIVAYTPLIGLMPKPPPKNPLEIKEIEYYDALSEPDFAALPMETMYKVGEKYIAEGKTPRVVQWGQYAPERPKLYDLQARAAVDFKFFQGHMIELLSNREKLIAEQKMFVQYLEMTPKIDREKAKYEMGSWIADYFDDAGYVDWDQNSQFYKAMVMTAFPPIDPLDDAKPDFATMPVETFEKNMTEVLKVMDSHLAIEQRRLKGLSTSSLNTLFRRR